MTPERWKQVEEVFQSAIDRPAGGQRAAFLDEVCGGDAELRRQVNAMIDSHERAGSSNEAPARAAVNATAEELRDELAGSIIGRRIGAYQVVREIGRGGMGAVYLAARADDVFDRRVAIKLVKRGMDTDFILRRFRHERQILANLDHPNIARLFDGGTTEDGLPYFVMEYIDGQPIHHYCDTQRLSVTERLRLFRHVCAAVAYAHQSRVIHRDIKPGNILVTADGTPKLLDFGIAKLLNPEMITDTYDPTGTALRLMTPEYASPEQVRGEPITAASDVYSLGVLLYELLSGHRPYPLLSRLPHEVARVICEVNPERPSVIIGNVDGILLTDGIKSQSAATAEAVARCRGAASVEALRRELAGDLDGVALKAMRKETSERYLSAEQFSEDIRRHLDGLPVSATLLLSGHDKIADGGGHVAGLLREPATADRSIAVLPLKTLRLGGMDDTGDEYLGLGLADAVINRLSNIRRITVRPTSSVLKYMHEASDPFTAGEELGVGFVLDGRIQRIGDRIRVTVQLVSMRDGAPLWASQFDENYTDILSLEDSISAQVAEALIPKLTGEEREQLTKRGTDNPEAFEAYLRGRYHWNTYTEEGLAKAIVHFNQAIAIDPSYAAAYTGVADYYNWLGVYGVLPPRECFSAAKEAAARAIAIDDTLAEAFASLGFAVWAYDWDWRESERLFKRALELNPNYLPAHEWYAHVLGSSGRHLEAIAEMRRAIELDPQSAALAAMFAFELRVARQYDEGVEQLRRALAIEPNNHLVLQGFGWVYGQQARYEEALAATDRAVELSGRTHLALWTHGYMLAVSGRQREARQVLAELHDAARHRYVSPCFMALINTGLGEHDAAFKCLDHAVELRDYWLVWLGVEPRFDALRPDPRFRQLLQRIESGKLKSGPHATTLIDSSFAPASRVADHHDTAHHRNGDEATSPSQVVDTLGGDGGARPLMRRLPAAALAVLLVLTGLIKRDGDDVAVTARLTDVRAGGTLWEEKYDERSTDIAAMQGKISERVTRAMTLELTSDEQQLLAKRYTDNSEAYQLYLAGRYHWGKRTGEAMKQAIYLFEQALSKDQNYALAYAGLADCYALLSWYNSPPPPDAFPKAKEAAMRAIQLDEGLAEAHASLAFVLLYFERDWAGAEREFRRAIELNPSYATAHHWYAFNLAAVGRHDEALAEIKRAQELDPNSLIIGTAVANVRYYARQYDQTIEQCLRTLEVDPGFIPAYMVLRGAYASKGLHDEAATVLQKENSYAGDHLGKVARLAHLYAAAGRRDEAHTALGELRRQRRQQPLFAYEIAAIHALLKEHDEAFAWLATAERERTIGFAFIKVDPDLDNLRADPRFDAMLRRTGLAQ